MSILGRQVEWGEALVVGWVASTIPLCQVLQNEPANVWKAVGGGVMEWGVSELVSRVFIRHTAAAQGYVVEMAE